MRVLVAVLVVVVLRVGGACAAPKSSPSPSPSPSPAASTATPVACGAPCTAAAKFLGGKQWDYRKAVKIYKRACKKDESGPPEACRRLALLGYETRGYTLDKAVMLRMLRKTCKRGDLPSCAWVVVYGGDRLPDLDKLVMVEGPCAAGDRRRAPVTHGPARLDIPDVVRSARRDRHAPRRSSRLAGHKSIETTRRYRHSDRAQKREAIDALRGVGVPRGADPCKSR